MRPIGLLLAIVFLSPVSAQTKHPFTFEDMMALKRVEEPQVSPDGKWVLFAAVDVDLKANTKTPHVWIVPLNQDSHVSQNRGDMGTPVLTTSTAPHNKTRLGYQIKIRLGCQNKIRLGCPTSRRLCEKWVRAWNKKSSPIRMQTGRAGLPMESILPSFHRKRTDRKSGLRILMAQAGQ